MQPLVGLIQAIFSCCLAGLPSVSLSMIRGKTSASDVAPSEAEIAPMGRGASGRAIASVIGAASALMGIGGGSIAVPVLSALALPVHRAVGTARIRFSDCCTRSARLCLGRVGR